MTQIDKIKQWQINRGLASMPYEPKREIANIVEELFEGLGVNEDMNKVATRVITAMITNISSDPEPTEEQVIDSWGDIIVFTIGSMLKLGYEPTKVMDEVIKEIESRGGEMGLDSKWMKEITGNEYKADFSKCKL